MTEVTKDLFKDINWDEVEAQEDFESEVNPLRGDYKARVDKFNYIEDHNFYSLNLQVEETVKGEQGGSRFLSKSFNLGQTQYSTEEESKEKLLKALKTIGVKTPEEAVGKVICIKARPNMDKETKKCKRDSGGWPKHIVTIVKEFKGATDSANVTDAGSGKIPF